MQGLFKKVVSASLVLCLSWGICSAQEVSAEQYVESAVEQTVIPESESEDFESEDFVGVQETEESFADETELEEVLESTAESESLDAETEVVSTIAETEQVIADEETEDVSESFSEEDAASQDPQNQLTTVKKTAIEQLEGRKMVKRLAVTAQAHQIKGYGVDVSSHNEDIDWKKVKAAGVKFAMIRVGYRTWGKSGRYFFDDYAHKNLKEATEAGIDVGVYFFSTALNKQEALEEAEFVVDIIKDYKITYPVVYDCEEYDNSEARNYNLSNEIRTANAMAFLDYVEDNGYTGMIYGSAAHFRNNFQWDIETLNKKYDVWVAQYPLVYTESGYGHQIEDFETASARVSSYTDLYRIWQFSSEGRVDGIDGDVDMNIEYEVPAVSKTQPEVENIKMTDAPAGYTGLFKHNASWYYVKNQEVEADYSGLVTYYDTTYYVKKGELDWSYTGIVESEGKGYYVRGGSVDWSYTGLIQSHKQWYYIVDGVWHESYTGLVRHYSSWYYMSNGILDWSYTGLVKYQKDYYYVEDGILNWNYTGLAKYYATTYYVQNGILNWNYTGLAKSENTWHYVQKGVLNTDYTGLVKYYKDYYYVENGILNWNYTGLAKYYATSYYIQNGVLNWKYTGLIKYKNTWYYIHNGALDSDYRGFVKHYSTWYYVKDGVVDFSYTD